MNNNYDNWERLVRATVRREEFRELARAPSLSSVSSDFSHGSGFSSPLHFDAPASSLEAPSVSSKGRTFQIEAFKYRKGVNANKKYTDKAWKILEQAIYQIYKRNNIDNFHELYLNAYNMVLYKSGEKLYSGLVSTTTFHLKELSESIEAAPGGLFLDELNTKWTDHKQAVHKINDVLMYMDRTFVPSTQRIPVYKLGLNLWMDNVIYHSKIQNRLQNSLLGLIRRERSGEVINREMMRNTITMLIDLGPAVYEEYFEKPFLEASANFYRTESEKFIECCDCTDYLKRAKRRLKEEKQRVSHYLDAKSEARITKVVEEEMIINHIPRLLHMENSGLVKMLLEDKFEDLERMYSLFCRAPDGLSLLRDTMTSHIRNTGEQLVIDPEKLKSPVEYIESLLQIRDKYNKIIGFAFNNDESFQNALKSSFEYFIPLSPCLPEYISLFLDHKLSEGFKGVKEEDLEIILDKVMMILQCVQEKDVFEKYYEQYLAQRLVSGNAVLLGPEKSMIIKLQDLYGFQFSSKLETMFLQI